MYFVALVKFKKKPDKAFMVETQKLIDADTKKGFKFHGIYWMLGKYDAVALYEAPSEKDAMKAAMERVELMDLETFVAIPREEVKKLVD
ncbi:MAG: GYD domain-containing protein [Methanoregula sp.]|jgi:uncharacterized protein with GYD domain|nr:GYD domain-containing protein [Methanoregula sp.]